MNLLFVCTGNTCRSPMAQAIAKKVFFEKNLSVNVESCGMFSAEKESASDNAKIAMSTFGLDINSHEAKPISKELIDWADLVLAMTNTHKNALIGFDEASSHKFSTIHEMAYENNTDLSDPYGQCEDTYKVCAKEIEEAILKIADKLGTIAIGNDHGGFQLKQELIKHLEKRGINYIDCGTHNEEATDYPIYAKKVSSLILSNKCLRGILICGTGIGISITANRNKGIRCALCHDSFSAQQTRLHNDANILAMGARVVGVGQAIHVLDTFLDTPFSNDDRHKNRIAKIEGDL